MDNENGQKWEIFKESENNYFYKYYEFISQCGWKFVTGEDSYTKDAIEWEFDIEIN
jgi:hypothetical protein